MHKKLRNKCNSSNIKHVLIFCHIYFSALFLPLSLFTSPMLLKLDHNFLLSLSPKSSLYWSNWVLLPHMILYICDIQINSHKQYILLYALPTEKAMAPHSSTLAWKIPWTEEPVRLQSMGSLRVGHDWATSLSLFSFMHWRRKWQPTPVFLPGESQGQGSLVGCRLWGRTESNTTEVTYGLIMQVTFLKLVFFLPKLILEVYLFCYTDP